MITLTNPITVNPVPPVTITSLHYTLMDDGATARAQIQGFPKPLILWTGADYATAGDYTQAQADARLMEILGNNPAAVLEALYNRPPAPPVFPKMVTPPPVAS